MTTVCRGITLTRLTPLGTLSRNAGEGGPSPQGWVGEGIRRLQSRISRNG